MFKKLDYNARITPGTGSRGRPTTTASETDLCEGKNMFKKLDCNALIDEDHTWNRVKRETYYLGMRNRSMSR
jgi:hypothetical protein